MSVGASADGRVQHAGDAEVVDVLPPATHEAWAFLARHSLSNQVEFLVALGSIMPLRVVNGRGAHCIFFAALRTASTICMYPVHMHKLPARASRISRSLGSGFLASKAWLASTMPGVQ